MTDRYVEALASPWVAVAPEFPEAPHVGWTIWTRGMTPNLRVAWLAGGDAGTLAGHIVALHNAEGVQA